jgi:hypothetical protein
MPQRVFRRLLLLFLVGLLLRLVFVVLLVLLLRPVVTCPIGLFLQPTLLPYRWCVIPCVIVIFVCKLIEALKAELLFNAMAN